MTHHRSLVVGAHGTIGSALFSYLQKMPTEVWGTTHKENSSASKNILHLNLLEPSTWQFDRLQFNVAYLCAGVCRMASCEDHPDATEQANVIGMSGLAQKLASTGTFIVYLSTNQVFSGETPFAAIDAPYAPLNRYGLQKTQAETLIKSECKQWAIVRLTKVIENDLAKPNLFKTWIDQLTQHQTIEAFHDMVLAPVSLRQVVEVLASVGFQQKTGCYQVSGAEDLSYYQFAQYIAQCLKRPVSLVQSVSALEKGIKKNFLPRFTTLDCFSTIAMCGKMPPHFSEVVKECLGLPRVNKTCMEN